MVQWVHQKEKKQLLVDLGCLGCTNIQVDKFEPTAIWPHAHVVCGSCSGAVGHAYIHLGVGVLPSWVAVVVVMVVSIIGGTAVVVVVVDWRKKPQHSLWQWHHVQICMWGQPAEDLTPRILPCLTEFCCLFCRILASPAEPHQTGHGIIRLN